MFDWPDHHAPLGGRLGTKAWHCPHPYFHGYNSLNAAQRNALENPPPTGSMLPYDDLVDVMLGRVLRDGQETPAVFSEEVATAYNQLGTPDWEYTIEHIADERPAPAGNLLDAMIVVAAPGFDWNGWKRQKSIDMVRALRASDLHLIGRVFVGLPLVARITFTTGATLSAKQELFISLDEDQTGDIATTVTEVDLG